MEFRITNQEKENQYQSGYWCCKCHWGKEEVNWGLLWNDYQWQSEKSFWFGEMSLREHFCLPRPQRWIRESWVQGVVVFEGEWNKELTLPSCRRWTLEDPLRSCRTFWGWSVHGGRCLGILGGDEKKRLFLKS